jgi:hypothetical protein
MSWLTLPADPPPPLWQGQLAIVESGQSERSGPSTPSRPTDLPSVSIGQPQVWPLVEVFDQEAMPGTLRHRLTDHDYYLVRLWCSFRVGPGDPEIEWARFTITLESDSEGHQPFAADLHPMTVTDEVQRDVKVALKPNLKFGPVDFGTLEAGVGLQYTTLEPVISAAGVGEPTVSWDYETTRISPLRGAKCMHLLAEAPAGMTTGDATIQLAADLLHRGYRLAAILRRREDPGVEPLKARLWG